MIVEMNGTLSCYKQMFYYFIKTLPFEFENFSLSAVIQQPSMCQFRFHFLAIRDCSPRAPVRKPKACTQPENIFVKILTMRYPGTNLFV